MFRVHVANGNFLPWAETANAAVFSSAVTNGRVRNRVTGSVIAGPAEDMAGNDANGRGGGSYRRRVEKAASIDVPAMLAHRSYFRSPAGDEIDCLGERHSAGGVSLLQRVTEEPQGARTTDRR